MATDRTPPKIDFPWMTEKSMEIVMHAVDGEIEPAVDALCAVGERYGGHGVFCLCYSLAECIAQMAGWKSDDKPDDAFWGLRVEHLERGVVAPEDLDENDKPILQAMRFVTAYLNRDGDQTNALFNAAETPEDAVDLPVGLIKLVQLYGRYRLEEARSSDAD